MARIAFILLCHKNPEAIVARAVQLTASGDYVAIHLDGNTPATDYQRIKTALADNENALVVQKRVRCGWGEWSLVRATLNALSEATAAFPRATHFYLLSGDCMPIKTAKYAHQLLDNDDADHIESVDFFEGGWIKTGLRDERLIYRHFFNERRHKRLFYLALGLQQRLGLHRKIPDGIKPMIGSQWWCLRRTTVEAILEFNKKTPRRDPVLQNNMGAGRNIFSNHR